MSTKLISTPLLPGHYYHIYNYGNNKERIFLEEANYRYFLRKYKEYLDPYVETFAYCLMPDHFHMLIRVKDMGKLYKNEKPSDHFRKFFQDYAIYFNKKYGRSGSLFSKYFRREEVMDQRDLKSFLREIHFHPQKQGITDKFQFYAHSSYRIFISDDESWINKSGAQGWFKRGKKEFLEFHMDSQDQFGLKIQLRENKK